MDSVYRKISTTSWTVSRLKILIVFTLVILFSIPSLTQGLNTNLPEAEVKFTPAELQQDFSQMRNVFTALHPALYEMIPKERFDKILDSVSKSLNVNLSALEFYRKIAPIISAIGCGHTAVGLPKNESNYIKNFIPVRLKFLNNKAYIVENFTENRLLDPGQELLGINNEPISKTVGYLFQFIQTDGTSRSNKYFMLDNKFDIYYGLFKAQPDSFALILRTAKGKKTKVIVPAARKPATPPKSALAGKVEHPFNMKVLPGNTALLTIDLFYVSDPAKKEVFPKFLDSCFNSIKQAGLRNLIIDLRQNIGGYGTWGALLYSYLTNTDFSYYRKAVVSTNKSLASIKNLKLDYTDEEYEQYLSEISETDSGEFVWTQHENLKIQKPSDNNYDGNVYILIGRKSFSTTAEFCAIAYSNKRAVFIGEETGGGYYNVNGGDIAELFLPNTGIKFAIPMRKYILAVDKILPPGSPTKPNYEVYPSIYQYINHYDAELQFALKLIKSKSSMRLTSE